MFCEVNVIFWFLVFGNFPKCKPHERNESVTPGRVRVPGCNETETEELLRNETETFWRNVTVSLRIVPAVPQLLAAHSLTFGCQHRKICVGILLAYS